MCKKDEESQAERLKKYQERYKATYIWILYCSMFMCICMYVSTVRVLNFVGKIFVFLVGKKFVGY